MGTLGALFGGVYLALPSGKKTPTQAPPINASSSDEADFIQYATPPPGPAPFYHYVHPSGEDNALTAGIETS